MIVAGPMGWNPEGEHHQARFSSYTVSGLRYRSENGDLAWHVAAWLDRPGRSYWIQEGNFFEVRFDVADEEPDRISVGSSKAKVDSREKRAISDAIATWDAQHLRERSAPRT